MPAGQKPGDGRGGALAWAFAISVLLHLLLLIAGRLPPSVYAQAADEPQERRLHFTFAPPEPEDEDNLFAAEAGEEAPERHPLPIPAPPPAPVPAPPIPGSVPPAGEAEAEAEALAVDELPADESGAVADPAEPSDADGEEAATPLPDPEVAGDTASRTSFRERLSRRLDIRRAVENLRAARAAAGREEGPETPGRVFVPDPGAMEPSAFGVGNLEFTSDFDWDDYGRQVYVALWREWHRQLYALVDEFENWAHVHDHWWLRDWNRLVFTIQRNGTVTDIGVLTASGVVPLDESSRNALMHVVLPPLPARFPGNSEQVRVLFYAEGPVRHLRQWLTYIVRRIDPGRLRPAELDRELEERGLQQ